MFSLVLLTSTASVNICGHRWVKEPEQWTDYRHYNFFFILHFVLVLCFAQNAAFASVGS